MSQDIRDFYQQITERDFARQFQFRIGGFVQGGVPVFPGNEQDFVYLESGSVPGRAITNIAVPFMGLQFNVPGTANYPGSAGYQLTFRSDADYNLREALERATRTTFNDQTSQGDYGTHGDDSYLELWLMGKKNTPIKGYKLLGAYVVTIGESAYNTGDAGTVVTIPATIAYHYWNPVEFKTGG